MHHCGPDKIRNVVLLSHSGSGKTLLAEDMLFVSKAISRLGSVDDGTSASDYDADEIKRKISINLALLPCHWKDTKVNIIDTPGYADFVAEVKSGLRISEGAVIVVCAASGVELGTERAWEYTEGSGLPRFIFINKMDRENVNFFDTLAEVQAKLGTKCLPVQLPIGSYSDFQGIVDLVSMQAYIGTSLQKGEIPSSLQKEVDFHREKLVEAVAEVDDQLISKYLEGEEISEEEIYRGIKQATILGKLVPVLAGSALANIGASSLLDAICDYLPSPVERCSVVATNPSTGAEEAVEPNSSAPLSAIVFKTNADPYVGKLSYFRVYSGVFASNSQVWNATKNEAERIGQLFVSLGKNQEPVAELSAGDIGTVAKLSVTTTGDTITLRDHPLVISPIEFPEPVLGMAIFPKSKADLDKMSTVLPRICEEDPSFSVRREAGTGELVIFGMGETHLEVAAERMLRKFGVKVELELPKVPYRESITESTKAEYKHKKQTGGHGQYGHVFLALEPLPRGSGFEFADKLVGGSVPKNYIPAVEKGVNEVMFEGVLARYPVVDIKVTLYDGSSHPVDSSDMAFKIAGAQALKKGLSQGQAVLLEPIVNLTVTVPESFTGDIIGDLNTKRARVLGMTPADGVNIIQAQAPQAEILRYAIDLRSITQGRGTYTSEFSHYEEVPSHTAQRIIAARG